MCESIGDQNMWRVAFISPLLISSVSTTNPAAQACALPHVDGSPRSLPLRVNVCMRVHTCVLCISMSAAPLTTDCERRYGSLWAQGFASGRQ